MKVGILTYYRSHNYGAMLQAVALRRVLQDIGHNTYYIDYWPQHQKNIYKLFDWEVFWRGGFRHKVHYLRLFLKSLIPKLMRRYNFYLFNRINIRPFVRSEKDQYDVIVYGSDQIWRKQGWGYGYNPVYFGKNGFIAAKHISYAASMGTLPESEEDIDTVIGFLKYLDCISVRELDLQHFLTNNGFKDVEQNVDPTFLLSKEEWGSFIGDCIISEPYLLLYDLQKDVFNHHEVNLFAKERGLKVIRINGSANYMPTKEDRTTDGPYEFLNLMFYADFVITSSFHGLAFSLIFQKPFLVSLHTSKSRVVSLLESVNLTERFMSEHSTLTDVNPSNINWDNVQKSLNKQKQTSLDYLRQTTVSL